MKNRVQTEITSNKMTELSNAELQAVSGGLNPQPLPPRVAYSVLFTNVAVRAFQGTFAWG
jgi:bacteriocin-like protein